MATTGVVPRIESLCRDMSKKFKNRPLIDIEVKEIKDLVEECCAEFSAMTKVDKGQEKGLEKGQYKGQDKSQERLKLENGMQILYYLEQALAASNIVTRLLGVGLESNDTAVAPDDLANGLTPFCKLDAEHDINKYQQLLLFLLTTLQSRGYRKYGQDCYEQLYTEEGYNTRAWKLSCSIKDFVYITTRKETNFDQWVNLTQSKGNAASAADYLLSCQDAQFPTLKKNRNVLSFRNGIYLTRTMQFVTYASNKTFKGDVVSAKYFDLTFDEEDVALDDWYSIETPHLQSILDFQGFDKEVSKWMYIMIGRLLYDVNDLDMWSVLPYLKGQASTGKSTILLRVCKNLYEKADVGVLSNNIEKKFGIGAFSDKYLFVAPEIKNDLQMEQAEFQSMVSGEDMSICVKYQTAQAREWMVPGIMAGNEVPGWVDNSGSITRRIVLFDFTKKVEKGDMELGKKIEREMASIVKKANMGYHWAVREYAKDNVWCHLPSYFHATRDDLSENTNVLEHFFKSNTIKFSSDSYMPWSDFLNSFQSHIRTHNFKFTSNFTKDYYAAAFIRYSLKKTSKESRTYRGSYYNNVWLDGADLVENES